MTEGRYEGQSNALPYFIGVFDTVATVANLASAKIVAAIALLAALSGAVGLYLLFGTTHSYTGWTLIAASLIVFAWSAVAAALMVQLRYKTIDERLKSLLEKLPFLRPFRFYDTKLNERIPFARHAMSIDENRADFAVVPWTENQDTNTKQGEARRVRQRWFAGVHSDIGGSYPDAESRLSDIALQWMAKELEGLPEKPLMELNRLNCSPDPLGMQHNELKAKPGLRPGIRPNIVAGHKVDESVFVRLGTKTVLHFDVSKPYRPENLRTHPEAKAFYASKAPAQDAQQTPAMI